MSAESEIHITNQEWRQAVLEQIRECRVDLDCVNDKLDGLSEKLNGVKIEFAASGVAKLDHRVEKLEERTQKLENFRDKVIGALIVLNLLWALALAMVAIVIK